VPSGFRKPIDKTTPSYAVVAPKRSFAPKRFLEN
jgi:hypothetical protein